MQAGPSGQKAPAGGEPVGISQMFYCNATCNS
jgi:hypothetical protein